MTMYNVYTLEHMKKKSLDYFTLRKYNFILYNLLIYVITISIICIYYVKKTIKRVHDLRVPITIKHI